MAQKRTVELDVNTNAEQVGNQFKTLNKSLDETTKSNKDLHASFEEVYGEIKPLTAQMGEMEDRLYQMAMAGEQTTDEFKNLLAEVGKYRKTQIETDLAVDTAAQTMGQKLGGALQGAASGFAVVQGAMGLFGTESEEVEAALLKVNSAMALAEGIKGVQEFSKSFGLASKATKAFTVVQKALNLVLKGNPFALIVTAVIALIGYFATFTDAINVVKDGLMAVTDWLGITDSEADEMEAKAQARAEAEEERKEQARKQAERLHNQNMNAIDNEIAIARAQGKDTTALQKKKINEILKIKKARLGELEVSLKDLEVQKKIVKVVAALMKLEGKEKQEYIDKRIKEIDDQVKEVDELKKDIAKAETELKILDINAKKRSREKSKNYKTESDNKKKIDADAKKKKEEEDAKELERQNAIEKKRLDNLKKLRDDFETSLEEETEIANARFLSEQELEIQAVQDKYFNLIEQAKQYGLETQILEDNQQKAIKEINDKYRLEKEAKEKEQTQKDLDREESLLNAKLEMAVNSLRLTADIASLFSKRSEKAAKVAFNIKKAADIAEATISGYKAVLSTFANAPGGPILKGIQAGIAGGFAALQIGKIASTKFESNSGSGDIGDVPIPDAGGGVGGEVTPTAQFNVVGDSGINQLAELSNQPTKAFVVSGEVTTAQSLDRNRIDNATI